MPCCCASTSGNAVLSPLVHGVPACLLTATDLSVSRSLKKNSRTYFYSSFLAYIFGLGLTIFVMHTFKHAQVKLEGDASARKRDSV